MRYLKVCVVLSIVLLIGSALALGEYSDALREERKKLEQHKHELLQDLERAKDEYMKSKSSKYAALAIKSLKEKEIRQYNRILRELKGEKNVIRGFNSRSEIEEEIGEDADIIALLRWTGRIDSKTISPFLKSFRELAEDDSKAVVLWIDTGGGSASASRELTEALYNLREKKPVVVFSGGRILSGGYHVSSNANKIVVDPLAEVAYIGVISLHYNKEKYYEKKGIRMRFWKIGPHKDMFYDHRGLSDEERKMREESVKRNYDSFVWYVARGRGMEEEEVRKYSEAVKYLGFEALDYGLVDKLGTLEDAIELAVELSEAKNPAILYLKAGGSVGKKEKEEELIEDEGIYYLPYPEIRRWR
ncbi:signal peptide peptidase SppA [Thermococci archaeon]|nr:MAG: signal peptide peptidase SppA [Thermococci archaeon]